MNRKKSIYILAINFICALSLCISLSTCKNEPQNQENRNLEITAKNENEMIGFQKIESAITGLNFSNNFDLDVQKSVVNYINSYNGGGVAVGDINNDGLVDIYLTGNLSGNKLFLNKGDLKFEEITEIAGVACSNKWSTGATFGDVNNDGLIDLYVSHSYYDKNPELRANSLFINKGNNTFIDEADKYGVGDIGYTIQSAFIDYNKDGHLDLYVGNTPRHETGDLFFIDNTVHTKNFKNPTNKLWSDALYLNDGKGKFINKTKEAGLMNYGFMLGVSIADYNQDGWQDIFVAVDHGIPDFLYINNQDGTFTNKADESFKHISLSSMGTDAADLNNDQLIDLVTLDMLSRDNFSEKTQMASMNQKGFFENVKQGFHYQYMRNMLQINQGKGRFSEVGQLAGIHKTDWSWSVLAADFSNDGWKDLFVTNGYYRSVMDKDLRKRFIKIIKSSPVENHKTFSQEYPKRLKPQKNKNVLFKNNGDLTYEDVSKKTSCDENGFSTGAIYADFDNDGDLDLVINNIDEEVSLLKNLQIDKGEGNFLKLNLKNQNNKSDIGTKIELTSCDNTQFIEVTYSRGYQSSYTGPIHFGLGNCTKIDELKLTWPNGKVQLLNNLEVNSQHEIIYKQQNNVVAKQKVQKLFYEESNKLTPPFTHKENEFDDYAKQVLLPHKMSQFGPYISSADVNGDGFEDFYVGGATGQNGALYLFDSKLKTYTKNNTSFLDHAKFEDMGSCFFDLDNDGDMDLYVVSGGNEFKENSKNYLDRLYINDGNGNFTYAKDLLEEFYESGSCVKFGDIDNDDDMDLFIGTRLLPGKYPFSGKSMILKNENGKLVKDQELFFDANKDMGMVTDAEFVHINDDGILDLVVVGEWMPISFMINEKGQFKNRTKEYDLEDTEGWWNCIEKVDLDQDGDEDFIVGNLGLNYKYTATKEKPFQIYAGDFDNNGKSDIVLGQYYQNDLCPVRGRQCSSEQIPMVAEKFPTYNDFGAANLEMVYGEVLKSAYNRQVKTFASAILINNAGKYKLRDLPNEAQVSPINSIVIEDLNKDNLPDFILGGNLHVSEVETGRADGGVGCILLNENNLNFRSISSIKSGLFIDKDVKSIALLNSGKGSKGLLIGNNDDSVQFLNLKQ